MTGTTISASSLALWLLAAVLLGAGLGAVMGWLLRGRRGPAATEGAAAAALAPVSHALSQLNSAVVGATREEAAARAALAQQLQELAGASQRSNDSLARETRRLVGALSRSDVRGRWGEMQLRRLLETSGLRPGVHYDEQWSVVTDDGLRRPDAVIHLGADQCIVIDAKVSLAAFLRAEAADPGPEQEAALADHTAEVAAHVARLSAKGYWRHLDQAPDFVVMFLPAESLLAEALARDPVLLEDAFAANVILATPTTLQALLRTVGHVWRQEAVAENARQIQALGRELHDRLQTLTGHFDKLGSALGNAVASYNRAAGSYESRVLVSARRFAELAGQPNGPEGPQPVTTAPRSWPGAQPGVGPVPTVAGVPLEPFTAKLDDGTSITLCEPAPARHR